jgi:hypothetical protein
MIRRFGCSDSTRRVSTLRIADAFDLSGVATQPSMSAALKVRAGLSGGGGIRTHEALARPTVFKTAPFDRSGTPPERIVTDPQPGRISAGAP